MLSKDPEVDAFNGLFASYGKSREILLGGDIVIEVLDIPFNTADDAGKIFEKLAALEEGDTLEVKVLRAGKEKTLQTFILPDF